ncbi:MAG: hypothetical protein CVU63_25265 [Deltaproteobacteria bacterium HGW-Deltaproteobacteria-20]|jgi:hypothetical protein|nr:MAG: hypothetical protein CVU63_25265 [Deltaproteobacteria bacterium HGW-Deltaproteobacteria-20]
MRIVSLAPEDIMSWSEARGIADETAARELFDPILLSWFDRDRGFESPAHASECHEACDEPGYIEYARSRGGELQVQIGGGQFVFCYRALGEFSDAGAAG